MTTDSPPLVIEQIPSLCAQCGAKIRSTLIEREGKVYQLADCAEHGRSESLVFSDSALYRNLDTWNQLVFGAPDDRESQTPVADPEHSSLSANTPTLGIIDLTNLCNYSCPLCFAENNYSDRAYFLPLDIVRGMLKSLLSQSPAPCRNVQFSGGEPTLHPEFPQILRTAREMGFTHIQIATNGSKFLDPDYAALCEEMGLHTLYLQFDGMSDDVYLKLRAQRLLDKKIAIVRNIARTNMRIVLVPTIAAGINVDQIGPIFNFAVEYSRHITGISIQPAAHIGRVHISLDGQPAFNLADMAIEFGRQTGLTRYPEDWFPLNAVSMITRGVAQLRGEPLPNPACDAHCSLGTHFYIDDHNRPICLNRFLDMGEFFKRIGSISQKRSGGFLRQQISRLQELNSIAACFHKDKAPKGMTFQRLLRGLDGWEDKSFGRGSSWFSKGFNGLFVAGMHFMDQRNYNFRRIHRCIVQYVTTSGDLIPFCSYNAGVRHRTAEELARMSIPSAAGPCAHEPC